MFGKDPDPAGEANVLPILNVMFLLIPALLLAMEIASVAAIPVSPPQISDGPGDPNPPTEQGLELRVMIAADGHHLRVRGEEVGPIVTNPDGSHDFTELELRAADFKSKYPDEVRVSVSAEGDVPLSTLIATLDALRGSDCKLEGDRAGEGCLFTTPVIESK